MIKINELVDKSGLERRNVFISLQHNYEQVGIKMVKELNSLTIPNWCMYDSRGGDTNKGGDNFRDEINRNLHKTCVFISLVSKEYIQSEEVASEIIGILNEIGDCTRPTIIFFPIYVDKTTKDEFSDFLKTIIKNPNVKIESDVSKKFIRDLTRKEIIDKSLKEDLSNLPDICEQIKEQYVKAIFSNIASRTQLIKNSCIFTDLLNLCIKQKCESNFVSEDIKNSTEISGSDEIHVLSNEILEYDMNTYSLIVISSNLLGEPLETAPFYDPKNKGSKYFYYMTKDYQHNFTILNKQIQSFIRKDRESRMKVSGLIRREFGFKNRVIPYFKDNFYKKSIDDVLEIFDCEKVRREIEELFEQESSRSFVSIWEQTIEIPATVESWLFGHYSDDINFRDDVNGFVNFINQFTEILSKNADSVDKLELPNLKKYRNYLNALKELDDWQFSLGKIKKSKESSRQLIRNLLNTSSLSMPPKQYPHIESWLQFNYDENGNVVMLDENTAQEAENNCIRIIVKDYSPENRLLKLCYSFALFIDKEGISGAWYTTGSRYMGPKIFNTVTVNNAGGPKNFDDMSTLVTTYSIRSQSDNGYHELLKAFTYLISVNSDAKKILKERGSKLIDLIGDYEMLPQAN